MVPAVNDRSPAGRARVTDRSPSREGSNRSGFPGPPSRETHPRYRFDSSAFEPQS